MVWTPDLVCQFALLGPALFVRALCATYDPHKPTAVFCHCMVATFRTYLPSPWYRTGATLQICAAFLQLSEVGHLLRYASVREGVQVCRRACIESIGLHHLCRGQRVLKPLSTVRHKHSTPLPVLSPIIPQLLRWAAVTVCKVPHQVQGRMLLHARTGHLPRLMLSDVGMAAVCLSGIALCT